MGYIVMSKLDEILGFFVIIIIIFLVLREVICWYWKINQNIALLTEIRDLLAMKGNSQGRVASIAQQSPSSSDTESESESKIFECDIPIERDANSIKVNPKVDYTDKFTDKFEGK